MSFHNISAPQGWTDKEIWKIDKHVTNFPNKGDVEHFCGKAKIRVGPGGGMPRMKSFQKLSQNASLWEFRSEILSSIKNIVGVGANALPPRTNATAKNRERDDKKSNLICIITM